LTTFDQDGGRTSFRLPDDLFNDAKVTVDIVFLRKRKAGKNPNALAWTKTPKIFIAGYQGKRIKKAEISRFFSDKQARPRL
jgi:hypothetical protein